MITQTGIFLFGVMAAWLTQQANERLRKYACIFGLISQPFWFYAAIQTNQWGIFILSLIYTAVWLIGFYNYWVKNSSSENINNSPKCQCGNNKPKNKPRCFYCD